jgi:hypothetical protein
MILAIIVITLLFIIAIFGLARLIAQLVISHSSDDIDDPDDIVWP